MNTKNVLFTDEGDEIEPSEGEPGNDIRCTTCGTSKKPIGRDLAPAYNGSGWCTPQDCEGYMDDPQPGSLWPGEEN